MKWILLIVVSFLPLSGMSKQQAEVEYCCYDELEGEPDLFKRYDQIVSGSVEFLYWTIAESGLDYALKMQRDAWGPTPSYAQGYYKNATYGMDPGLRLGFLYFRAPHYWEIRWQYTRMTSRGENSAQKPDQPEQFLTGTWPQITTAPLTGAHSKLHFNYNVFDWLVDRVFFPNPHLRLRLLGGAAVAWMDQDWKVIYNDATPFFTTIRNRWSFIGAGLKSGTIVDWYWTGDLYMTAQGFFGLLIGSYSNRSEQTTTFQPTGADDPTVPVRDGRYKDTRPTVTGQMIFGPSYQKNFCSSRLEIFAGFEMNVWFNLQEVYRSTQAAASMAKETWINSGLLSLYGLTTRVSLDF